MSSRFDRVHSETIWRGKIFSLGRERFRHHDGKEVVREKVWHPGAVAMLAVDDDHVWLTRQPREVVGVPDSLEIPAGKLDVEGEAPLAAAQRELAEEIGMRAERWREITSFYTSAGFSDERIICYLAEDLSPAPETEVEEDERIEVVRWPLSQLDAAIAACEDAKSLIAMLWLARERVRRS
ncbi:MAG: NUDIX hydrolase [Solirubrobacterales bacterium]|nr:NUDIX hydrolase [Solirubrobacterales bacterium]